MEEQAHVLSNQADEDKATKMLGAHVDETLYWAFKKAAAARNEQLKDAMIHAARMYIELSPKAGGG